MTSPLLSAALDAHLAGRLADAERSYRAALDEDPGNADALHLLGLVRERGGDAAEGEALIRRAIAIRDEAVFNMNLATLLLGSGRHAEAEAAYRRSLAIRPDLRDAAGRLGTMLLTTGRAAEADDVLTEVLRHGTGSVDLLNLLGVARLQIDDFEGAEWAWREALALAPQAANIHYNLGNLFTRSRQIDRAEASFRAAIAHHPEHVDAHYNLGTMLLNEGRLAEARAAFDSTLSLRPDHGDARFNIGLLQVEAGETEGAEASFRGLIAAAPDRADARLALGTMLLRRGDFAEGWPLYEARYAGGLREAFNVLPDVSYPQWKGEDLAGKSILLWPEQGYGDAIQFVRYVPELKRRGAARVTLGCHGPLARLFAAVEGADAVVTERERLGHHDYWALPLSLPLHLGTVPGSIPASLPYLHASDDLKAAWSQRLPDGGLKVGLAWKGAAIHGNDARRSLPSLSNLEPLWRTSRADLHFIGLQKGEGEVEARDWASAGRLIDLGRDLRDFADTAAVVDQLDLVITVDTSVAHLAGALGKPCWVLLPAKGADWRWLEGRSDSPWYPGTMRLFRQERDGNWSDVVGAIAAALKTFESSATTFAC